MKRTSGFTLIELLVVATIIIVLASIGIVSFTNAAKSARDAKRKADMETIRQALTLYRQQNTGYPVGSDISTMLNTLKSGYISEPVPQDPGTGGTPYTYYGSATAFCVCAQMDNTTKGNSSAGATGTSCPGLNAGTTHYCVKNL